MKQLIKDVTTSDEWPMLEGECFFSLFDRYIEFYTDDYADLAYATRCIEYLNNLDDAVIDELCRASIRYHNASEPVEFSNPRDVLTLITPCSLMVPNPENGDEPVIHLELNCSWEVEHGMEWLIRGDEVLYVGHFTSVDCWGDYQVKDRWNYA
ncbi:DUF6985 domain-containing protein [Budvicia aquatica]|uniref:DUF6985 domain-containing protein n=1 Tax=Budvicia aquatica TaxID=82979 RepID=UPI001B564CDA|nr:hypothetical protein [Budvicia aquatica]MBP9644019.1 hypothetical protein [Budvicia sp.]GKX49959.1 hypothetical protein SOASR029_02680 [Budvicia aquatica]